MKVQPILLTLTICIIGLSNAENFNSINLTKLKSYALERDPMKKQGPKFCDPLLLSSYDLEPIHFPTTDKNFFCKNIKHNCCTLTSQNTLYTKWLSADTRGKSISLYSNFLEVWGKIFDGFKSIEELAAKVAQISNKNSKFCKGYAEQIVALGASSQKAKVLELAKKAYRFLYDARRGLPCSLCDAEAHKAVDGKFGRLRLTHSFCGKIVQETMPLSLFKQKRFLKMARALGQFLLSCNNEGIYKRNSSMSRQVKFFKNENFLDKIDKCTQNLKDNEGVAFCHDYCSHFNPTKFDRLFEDDLAKLYAFEGWVKKKLASFSGSVEKGFAVEDLNFTGRVLAEANQAPVSPPAQTVDPKAAPAAQTTAPTAGAGQMAASISFTGISYSEQINTLRKDFGLQLKTGITYSASLDFTHKFRTNFSDSIFPVSDQTKFFDLSKLTIEFNKDGINYLKYGYDTAITDANFAQLLASKLQASAKSSQQLNKDPKTTQKDSKTNVDSKTKEKETSDTKKNESNSKNQGSTGKRK